MRLQTRCTEWPGGLVAAQGRGRGPDAGDVCAGVPELASRSRPGTNLRAWLLRILTNLNIDRGRRAQRTPDSQPLEEGDYFLYNRLEAASGESDEERILERLSQDHVAEALAAVPHDFRDVLVLVDIGDFTLRGGGADPRHSDRHRHVAPSSWAAYPEAAACGTCGGGRMSEVDPCDWCEEVLQPYLDRELNPRRAGRGRAPPRGVQLVREAVQVRGGSAPARAAGRDRADGPRAEEPSWRPSGSSSRASPADRPAGRRLPARRGRRMGRAAPGKGRAPWSGI